MKKKICFFTGSRAEYGLLEPLINEFKEEHDIEIQLLISGTHLSPEFGLTHKEISLQKLKNVEKIEILLSSDTSVGISKAMGLGLISFAECLDRLKPDLLVGLGDRFEFFSAVAAAVVAKVPVAHIHGGEQSIGAYDDYFRHSVTKMSYLHFTSTEEYRRRVIQLGEDPERVFYVGALGIENIKKIKLLSKKELENLLQFDLSGGYFVVTLHPVTLEKNTSEKYIKELLEALDQFSNYKLLFTKPNADSDGRIIIRNIEKYRSKNPLRVFVADSLGQLKYLSALKYTEMLIGNSSSGIIEMPSFKKPSINIGNRQKGRIMAESVINCQPICKEIISSINIGLGKDFKDKCQNVLNPYEKSRTSKNIKRQLMKALNNKNISKVFYDIRF